MVHAMTALRRRGSLILDTCEIFVKEPLLDWVKDAKQRQQTGSSGSNKLAEESIPDSMLSEYDQEL